MDVRQVGRHPEYPRLVWVVIEQPPGEEYRLRYHPEDDSFRRTQWKNLAYVRGFTGAYGWIGGLGTPPDRHCDVILITRQQLRPGAVALAHPCGIFYRSDGDHKVAALDDALRSTVERPALAALAASDASALRRLYPGMDATEGWWDAVEVRAYLERWDSWVDHQITPRTAPTWGPGSMDD